MAAGAGVAVVGILLNGGKRFRLKYAATSLCSILRPTFRRGHAVKSNTYAASVLVLAGVVSISHPALSQGATGPGGAPMAPQPRVAPAPQAPGPVRAPTIVPNAPVTPSGAPQGIVGNGGLGGGGRGGAGGAPSGLSGNGGAGGAPSGLSGNGGAGGRGGNGGNGGTQAPSSAPLPSGYAYDATGRIVFVGGAGGAPSGLIGNGGNGGAGGIGRSGGAASTKSGGLETGDNPVNTKR